MELIKISDIICFLQETGVPFSFSGDEDTVLSGFSSLSNYKENSFTWIKKQGSIPSGADLSSITLAIVSEDVEGSFQNVIRSPESKHAFFSSIEHFYEKKEERPQIGQFTYIAPTVKLGKNVRIGHNCCLDGDITIGDNTVIWNNVSIINRVVIGHDTEIQSGTIIGHDGFGYTEDEHHVKTMVKHFGGVRIGNHVLVSSNVCVVRGTIDDTVIEDGVKIDNLCHVAHNCYLGENAAMAFPCFLGGSSRIERNGYVAQGVVRNQCTVHENGFVGMGAVVTKDVPADTIVVGNPAKPFIKK
jgi:UDP-3-O-[3-hydroxymyristoyl] glucosamine N-acyltransferase